MANTTDMMVTCFDEDDAVARLCEAVDLRFEKVSDGNLAGGPKVLSIEAYGACYRSLGVEKIAEVVAAFKATDFDFPELATLTIDDDNQVFNGVVLRQAAEVVP